MSSSSYSTRITVHGKKSVSMTAHKFSFIEITLQSQAGYEKLSRGECRTFRSDSKHVVSEGDHSKKAILLPLQLTQKTADTERGQCIFSLNPSTAVTHLQYVRIVLTISTYDFVFSQRWQDKFGRISPTFRRYVCTASISRIEDTPSKQRATRKQQAG
jgi:hypothetical protein